MTNEEWSNHPCYQRDPLPEIPPALLSSMDVKRYIDSECLIDPKEFDKNRLQPASYQMKFLGEADYWENENGILKRKYEVLCEGKIFEIRKNSILYILLKEQFRLPEYIAARFNLHIRLVHKGLLLGTGPMVHPGFFGRLLIPLHNLTDNDYLIKCGDPLIWVEFTKLSGNSYWGNPVTMSEMDAQDTSRHHERPEFLIRGKTIPQYGANEYLEKADVHLKRGVQSAFKGELKRTEQTAKHAEDSVNWFKKIGFIAGFGLLIALMSTVWTGYSLVNDFITMAHEENRHQIDINRKQQIEHMTNINDIMDRIYNLQNRTDGFERELEIFQRALYRGRTTREDVLSATDQEPSVQHAND